jgi:hypothetical protein
MSDRNETEKRKTAGRYSAKVDINKSMIKVSSRATAIKQTSMGNEE